jgi:hypothetical protein
LGQSSRPTLAAGAGGAATKLAFDDDRATDTPRSDSKSETESDDDKDDDYDPIEEEEEEEEDTQDLLGLVKELRNETVGGLPGVAPATHVPVRVRPTRPPPTPAPPVTRVVGVENATQSVLENADGLRRLQQGVDKQAIQNERREKRIMNRGFVAEPASNPQLDQLARQAGEDDLSDQLKNMEVGEHDPSVADSHIGPSPAQSVFEGGLGASGSRAPKHPGQGPSLSPSFRGPDFSALLGNGGDFQTMMNGFFQESNKNKQEVEKLKEQVEILESQLVGENEEKNKLKAEHEAALEEAINRNTDLQNQLSSADTLLAEAQVASQQVESLEQQVARLEQEVKSLKQDLAAEKDKYEKKREKYQHNEKEARKVKRKLQKIEAAIAEPEVTETRGDPDDDAQSGSPMQYGNPN